MGNAIYEVVIDGHCQVRAWALKLQKAELGKLNAKLDLLAQHGAELPPGLLAGTDDRHIDKIRIKGQRALRVFLCRGPINIDGSEFTLLHTCVEKDSKIPPNTVETAADRRAAIIHGNLKRVKHERYKR